MTGRVFDSDGSAATDEFVLHSSSVGHQAKPLVALLSDGRICVAWDDTANGKGRDIKGRFLKISVPLMEILS